MSIPAQIIDGAGTKVKTIVTKIGQLVTSPYDYDETTFTELAEDDTAYNFYKPRVGQQFVITGIIASADAQVSNTADATVVVYEASSTSTLTVDKTLLQLAMVRFDQITFSPNILVREGKFVNAKTTDDDIHMTITGYYIPKLS